MYAIGELSAEKKKILNQFVEFTQQEKYQTLANKYGFNGLNQYKPEAGRSQRRCDHPGAKILESYKEHRISALSLWPMFPAAWTGEPLNNLKKSLSEGQKYIGQDNLIGLVSYSDDVHIDLPIAKFNLTQRAMFAGAVDDLQAGGSTATFDAIAVAMQMIEEQQAMRSQSEAEDFRSQRRRNQ